MVSFREFCLIDSVYLLYVTFQPGSFGKDLHEIRSIPVRNIYLLLGQPLDKEIRNVHLSLSFFKAAP